ncbi:MAG: SpoIVB peptidase S55 domain-containing protein [Armatimonadota bacterium]
MTRLSPRPVLLMTLAAVVCCVLPVSPDSGPAVYPLSQVRAGQVAVAKSVFRGTKIESFHVKIIGVVPKYDGARSLILGRILDGTVVARNSGTIAGMSGSPVYLNGRLAGAISMAWSFSKEPICGITPIEDMLETLAPVSAPATAASAGLASPVRINGQAISRVQVAPAPPSQPDPPGVMTLVPLGGLLQVSGFSPRCVEQLREQLAPYGLRLAAGGGGVEEKMRPPMVPGAAVGARLVGGDFDLTGLGTVTLVAGKRVLAFGHPLLSRGDVDLPMTGGYVYDILPSAYLSNKLMSPTQVIGRVSRDDQSAIGGTLGEKADMLPVTIEATDADLGRSRVYRVEVARIRELTPGLVASVVMTAVDELRGRVGRGMARVRVEIDAANRTLVREDIDYSPADAAAVAMPAVLRPLSAFTESAFGTMRIDRVRVRIITSEARKTATVERVAVSQARPKAGDEVTFSVTVRPYGAPLVDIPVTVKLPADLPKGQLRIAVTGGSDADQARASIGAPRPAPVNMDQLVERYLGQDKTTDLVLQVALTRGGASLSGEEFPSLPRTAMEKLGATRPTDLRPVPSVVRVVVPTDWALTGRQTLMLSVESPVSAVGGPPRPREEAPPEEGESEGEEASLSAPLPGLRPVAWSAPSAHLGAGRPAPGTQAEGEEKKEAPLTRAADLWTQSGAADYEEAKLSGVKLSGDGALSLGLAPGAHAAMPADVVWAMAARDGAAYVGTGKEGRIYRMAADGAVAEFADTGEMNVHSLAFAGDGALIAGTSPRGKVFRIGADGKCELLFDSESTYIWALAVGPDGAIYAGAGAPARVYALSPGATPRTLAQLPASNVLSLALGQQGELYAGTSDSAIIFRVAPDGAVSSVGQLPGASVDSLALDQQGNLFATCSPGAQIYRAAPGQEPQLYLETGEQSAFGLTLLPDGTPVTATGPNGLVIRGADRLSPELLFRPEAGLATAIAQESGALSVATSGPAGVFRFGPERASSGTVESDVMDAGRPARWGRVNVSAELPEGTRIGVETRSGDSPVPGEGWGQWTPTVDGAVASRPARYLEYRLTLSTDKPNVSPMVRQVTTSRRPQNLPPAAAIRSPEAGQYLSKQQSVKWQAQDPDKDPLGYRVEVSLLSAATPTGTASAEPAGAGAAPAQPAPSGPAQQPGASWQQVAKDLREPKCDWDTSKQKDGQYLLRVTASDALSQPDDPLAGESYQVVWVDNTPPNLMLLKSSLVVDEERRATLGVLATDKTSPIRSIEFRVAEGEWQSVPTGLVASSAVPASVVTGPLEVGKHKLSVRAFDAAGNVAGETTDVEVKESKPAPAAAPGQAPAAPAAEAGATQPTQVAPSAPAPAGETKPAESAPPSPAPQP